MASAKKSKNKEEDNKKEKSKLAPTAKTPTKKSPAKSPKQEKLIKKKKNNTANGTRERSASLDVLDLTSSNFESQESEDRVSEIKNASSKSSKKSNIKKNKRAEGDDEEGEDENMVRFPMARIRRIIKIEDSALQLNEDVVFLVNKATEKFIQQFCEDAYDCSVRDRKKSLSYKHLASVVRDQRRFDFLSDFVPEKLNAQDALTQRKLVESSKEYDR